MKYQSLAIITARGGSKGLPGKHLLNLCGKKVIDYTFEYAQASKLTTRIILSTDDDKIASAAESYGIQTIPRLQHLATDNSRIHDTLIHVVEYLAETEDYHPDYVALLYGSTPVRKNGLLDKGLMYIQQTGCADVRSMISVGAMHPDWMSEIDKENKITPLGKNPPFNRQDTSPVFIDDGAIAVFTLKGLFSIRNSPQSYTENSHAIIVEKFFASIDINDINDFQYAKFLLERLDCE